MRICSRVASRKRARISPKRLAAAATKLTKRAGGTIDVAIVLGSGLAPAVLARIDGRAITYDKLDLPPVGVAGHLGIAHAGTWAGRRVVAFAGRAHLYQDRSARDVTEVVHLAAATGAKTIVLTNAAGGLDPSFVAGDLMTIADHLNLTGASPIPGDDPEPFVNMRDAYAPHLRALARAAATNAFVPLRDGIYAGVRGPQYETSAESEMLRRLGAHAVGMSTVLEAIAARRYGLDVLGLSLITNVIAPDRDVSHAEVLAAARGGSERIAKLLDGVLRDLPQTEMRA